MAAAKLVVGMPFKEITTSNSIFMRQVGVLFVNFTCILGAKLAVGCLSNAASDACAETVAM
jgi:hypothetical protein